LGAVVVRGGVVAAIAVVAAIIVWGAPHITNEGTITRKEFTPAHTTVTYQRITSGKTTTTVPVTIHHPAKYCLYLYRLYNDKRQWGYVCVSAQEYGQYEVGDWYPRKTNRTDGTQ
jgi:hypothetical protein